MIRSRVAIALLLVAAVAFAAPASATHNNRGTVKVHDNEDENPDVRNVPHVSCDFWIEGFFLGDDSGWIEFFGWPPTGNKTEVTPTGASLDWDADSGAASGEYHFLNGPYYLPAGHYRVEIYTDDGHPGSDSGHFAKSKTFWVEPCEEPFTPPPCPTNLQAVAQQNGDVLLSWTGVANASAYVVYRAVGEGDFEMIASTMNTTYLDTDTSGGITYSYYVTAVIGEVESENCDDVTVTAIPFFPGLAVGTIALLGSVGAFVWLRRRS